MATTTQTLEKETLAPSRDPDQSIFDVNNSPEDLLAKFVKKKIDPTSMVLLRDKISFILGVMNVALTCFTLGRFPEHLPTFFTFKAIILIGMRYLIYRKKGWHYFLFDFCYSVNLLVLVYLYILPNSRTLFLVCFSLANGPLAWAIVTWRNSMVFHSLDKMTSIFIHLGPNVLLYGMRWFYAAPKYDICGNEGYPLVGGIPLGLDRTCEVHFLESYVYPFAFYFLWQISYLLKVEVVSKQKVVSRNYVTSLKWIMEDKGSILHQVISGYGYYPVLVVFVLLQFVYTVLTITPVKLLFDHQWIHTTFLIGILLVSLYNGANFYMEVFSRKYITEIEAKKKPMEKTKAK